MFQLSSVMVVPAGGERRLGRGFSRAFRPSRALGGLSGPPPPHPTAVDGFQPVAPPKGKRPPLYFRWTKPNGGFNLEKTGRAPLKKNDSFSSTSVPTINVWTMNCFSRDDRISKEPNHLETPKKFDLGNLSEHYIATPAFKKDQEKAECFTDGIEQQYSLNSPPFYPIFATRVEKEINQKLTPHLKMTYPQFP
ncbi:hypothetical protein EVAR_8394_1 [Eumeta japonica]|uniref:Uncharacterized protein n=1 Tax=Eumeta variegata TaxID=151549 RepID=A0A4C1VD74_EUMVA|nr:hypothetical protein EVAR_8394_1 [Eumeta japonica]